MRYCFSCKFLSPDQAIYCGHCGRSFGGRRCPHHHLSPPDASLCIQCATPELTEATGSFQPTGILRLMGFLAAGVVGWVLFRQVASWAVRDLGEAGLSTGAAGAGIFRLLEHLLQLVIVFGTLVFLASCLLHLIPGNAGVAARRAVGSIVRLGFHLVGLILRTALRGAADLTQAALRSGSGRSGPNNGTRHR